MSLKYKNENYAAIVVEIKTLIPLAKCDRVQAAIIMGQQVVVGKDIQIGDIGLYFPVECALSKEYLTANNLYRKPDLNSDPLSKGYFEENGRIRCVKFQGHKSEGLFMPIESMDSFLPYPTFEGLKVGVCFDELNGISICSKYIVKTNRTPGLPGNRNSKVNKQCETKLVENQFRFHNDTSMLYKNLDKIQPDSLISITYKMHGTSGISSYVLCKKKLSWIEKFLSKWFTIEQTIYDYLYSSRKVIKNAELNPNAQHFYGTDIWGLAHEKVKPFLQKGMTFYYEVVGYLPSGAFIQGHYDYGQEMGQFGVYLYRITSTNIDGKVIEFSAKQVQDFCKSKGLNAVPELYYGKADNFIGELIEEGVEKFPDLFLMKVKEKYNEKNCYMCSNKTPEEGAVIRIEGNEFEAFKAKSTSFYELETKQLDKGEVNIEDNEE